MGAVAWWLIFSDMPTRRQVLERVLVWAVCTNLVRPLHFSAVDKNTLVVFNRLRQKCPSAKDCLPGFILFHPADPRGITYGIFRHLWHFPQVVPRAVQTTGSRHPQPTLPNC